VMMVELINTAIEVLVDKISPEYDRQAGNIKDISAAAVLITALMALIIGLIIFIPKYF
jgi:diacylglycerol kinase